MSPEVASRWDASQREAARHVLVGALHAGGVPARVGAGSIEERLAELDGRRAEAGDDALGLVVLDGERAVPTATDLADAAHLLEVQLDDGWRGAPVGPERALGVLQTFGADAGARGPIVIVPGPRLAAIAGYERGRLVVNPVVIAAIEPSGYTTTSEGAAPVARVSTKPGSPQQAVQAVATAANGTIGNPYSFYGSVAECAAVQRSRCEACVPASNCVPVTDTTDGAAECGQLAANGGRGYFLLCINAALAITSVDRCAASHAASCPRDTKAADSLSNLDANADFLDMPECSTALDSCLTTIFGKSNGSFPGPGVDAGTSEPPRTTDVSCGNSCSNNNCDASPNCSCSGPSCNNSLSCDSTCASSNNSSGCGGTSCDSCSSSSSGGGGGGGGGTCSSSSSSGGGGGGTCSSSSSSGGSSSSCGSCSNSSSSGGGGGNCGSCSNSSSGGSSNCGSCGSSSSSSSSSSCGGSGGKCGVARGEPNAAFALILSVGWGLLPIPFAARARRRARRRKPARDVASANQEVQP
ncbi:MAG: hypothetical protein JO257_24150 [Deltaproteobacteria bacterium]|nr:hypothetical protein [Deltaproteobacteria bacterium]